MTFPLSLADEEDVTQHAGPNKPKPIYVSVFFSHVVRMRNSN